MAYVPRSSFIPKEASGAIPMQVRKRRSFHIFGFLATTLLVLALIASVGVFFYGNLLEKRLESAKSALAKVSQSDDDAKVEEIRAYDEKLKIANTLLDNHIAPSALFKILEDSTKKTIQFDSFTFTYDPGFSAMLTLSGNTDEFASVALQKMQFVSESFFTEFAVRDIVSDSVSIAKEGDGADEEEDTRGKVGFSVTGLFKEGILNYTSDTEVAPEVPQVFPSTEQEVVSTTSPTSQGTSTPNQPVTP